MLECRWILLLLGGTSLLRLALIGLTGPAFEEAYYWNYSQHPMLSYFDHPPMVAWLIGLSTRLGEDSAFWVRLPSPILFLGSSLLAYHLGSRLVSRRVGLGAALLMSLVPAFTLYSLAMTPDAPLLFFWALAIVLGWEMLERNRPEWWLAIGCVTGLAMLSKYPGAFIPVGIIVFALWSRRWHLILTPYSVLGAAVAMLVFSPVILWNSQHEWASFLYQGVQRYGESTAWPEKLGSWLFQLALWSPPGFAALLGGLYWGWQRCENLKIRYLFCSCVPFLGFLSLLTTQRLVQINWPLPGYFAATILVSAFLVEGLERRPRAFKAWSLAIVLMAGGLTGLPYFGAIVPSSFLNRLDTVNGWEQMASRLMEIRSQMPEPRRTMLVGNGYEISSEIAFYTKMPKLTLSNDIFGERAKSYSFWESADDFFGWDAVIVASDRHKLPEEHLVARFESFGEPEVLTVERGGEFLRRYYIYRAYGYRGPRERSSFQKENPDALVSCRR